MEFQTRGMGDSMTQHRRPGLTGPLALAIGGCITTTPLLIFFYLLHNGQLAYTGIFIGMLLFVMFMLFAGLFTTAIGLQLILDDTSRRS